MLTTPRSFSSTLTAKPLLRILASASDQAAFGGDRAWADALQPRAHDQRRGLGLSEGQQALPRRGGVRRHASTHTREGAQRALRFHPVHVHHIGTFQHADVHGLAAFVVQPLQWCVGHLAQLERADHQLAQLVQLQAQPVAVVLGLDHEPLLGERAQHAVDAALAHRQLPPQLGDAHHRMLVAERLQHLQRLGDGRELVRPVPAILLSRGS